MNLSLGDIVATAPQPHRPRWWWLILGMPLLRWRRAMREWRARHVYRVAAVGPAPCVAVA